mmetsp:Transcript_30445/g.86055  ORF Transcript_30445/g.86055 Transcript_30445/m.86055 type:complete len:916 (+) Transcript_30445:131-2878(+)|eukprot:CAMPEP_0117679678 /NCGR_PEP_ID=MMETSP0804-20121206/17939_1 /TAXON_ID=1074897 /ORGANISM="Tetraselmis astigmatica, Strain CCMP880" /LENGTH=915 /DNA_ID=CAMNT_0005489109 /DNA_START=86 /DNA_END=2833 /DNA_ORIENTATION=-
MAVQRVALLRSLLLILALVLAPAAVEAFSDRDESSINQDASCETVSKSPPIWPTEVGSPVLDLRWIVPTSGNTAADVDKVVLALTEGADGRFGGHLYRSDQYGRGETWVKVNDELKNALSPMERSSLSSEEHELGVLEMFIHGTHPHHILLQGNSKFHWSTRDYGRTFLKVEAPGGVDGRSIFFKLHPTNPDFVLARVRSAECSQSDAKDSCVVDLYVSTDFGASWTSLTANSKGRVSAFVDFEWGAKMHPDAKFAGYDEKTIFATIYESDKKAPGGEWDERINFVRSDDFFTTKHKTFVECGNAFEIVAGKIFLAVPSDCPVDSSGKAVPVNQRGSGTNAVIYVSEDFGRTFAESCVPVKHVGDKGYELRETHDRNGVYVLIDHDEEERVEAEAPVFNLYSSGHLNATLFSLSLERVFSVNYYGQRLADWHRVEGLPGVFITNQLEVGAMTEMTMKERNWNEFVETMITFNGGGHWQHLQAPKTFRNEKCNLCGPNENCRLHLHGASSWVGGADGRPSVYSHGSAPGVLMASGNTGNHLDFDQDFQCTWLSRDGGYTWEDVAHGMFIYEYGDHGGLLLMARHRNQETPTDTLHYSYDQGRCWHSVKLGESLYLENIRVEPKGASNVFMLHGVQCENDPLWSSQGFNCTYNPASLTGPKGVLYTVAFDDITHWGNCDNADFEDWSPPVPDLCLLGHNFTLERRKRDSKCFNSKLYERPVSSKICECSNEDVECDYGYFRSDYLAQCDLIETISEQRSCPAIEEGYKLSSTHMRRVHADNCSNLDVMIPDINKILPHNKGYPHNGQHHGFSFGRFLLTACIVTGVLTGLFVAWVKLFASEDVKDSVQEACSPITSCCGSSLGWLGDCFMEAKEKLSSSGAPTDAFFRPLAGEEGLNMDESETLGPLLVNPNSHSMQ